MSIKIDDIVSTTINISAAGITSISMKDALFYVSNEEATQDLAGTVKTYYNIGEIIRDGFNDSTELYKAATTWFSGDPSMDRLLVYFASDTGSIVEQLSPINEPWFWFFMDARLYTVDSVQSNVLDVANYCSENKKFFMNLVSGTDADSARTESSTNDIVARLNSLGLRNTASFIHKDQPYAGMAFCKWFASVDYDAANSTITGEYKKLRNIVAEDLTTGEQQAQKDKRAIWYGTAENAGIKDEGRVFNSVTHSGYGEFMDSVIDSINMVNDVQTNCYNILTSTTTKIPYTPIGFQKLITIVSQTLLTYVNNGYLGEREITDIEGQPKTSIGYEIITRANDINDATQEMIAERKPPAIVYEVYPANAIHKLVITGTII